MTQFDIYLDDTKEIYADCIPTFPASSNWGNLSNKVAFIFYRLDYLNDILVSIFEKVELYNYNFKKRNGLTDKRTKIAPYIEMIHLMNDLRMIIDELIALLYIVEQRKLLGDYPNVIEIDSIGVLLGKWDKGFNDDVKFFVDYKVFLKRINRITNTYKHSFLNDHVLFLRQLDEPTVFAPRNSTTKNNRNKFVIEENTLIMSPLKDIINDFNKMFIEYRALLKALTIEQLTDDFEKKKLRN